MINATLIYFLLLPILIGIAVWWFTDKSRESAIGAGAFIVACFVVVGISFAVAKGSAVADTEIWNGKITGKDRVHGSYIRSYSCNCTTDSKGNQTCQTCFENHYTVNWSARSTVGGIGIDSKDWTSSSVYNVADPARYTNVIIGEPCSREHSYVNYVQAVPSSLFTPSAKSLKEKFANLLPKYPDSTFDIYRNNHFVTAGYVVPDATAWNTGLAELLKDRGPSKQVNAIVVIAKTADPNYVYALRDAWEGANKNDVVLVIGSAAWPKIDFVDVISWTKNELFKVQLRDNVMAAGVIQREPILGMLGSQIDTNFERRHMSEFTYLKAEIDPPTWLLVILAVLMFGGAAAAVYMINQQSWTPRPSYRNRFGRNYGGPM